jgi:hypothetical protein
LETLRLFVGVNVHTLRIFNQLPFLRLGVGEFNDTGRDGKQLGQLSGTVTPRSCNQLEAFRVRAYSDGLNEAVMLDAVGKLLQLAFVKSAPWVRGGLVNGVDSEILKCAAVLYDCLLGRVGTCGVVGAGRPEPSALMRERIR